MKLVVGLGNPGKDYQKTRHNIGFMVLDSMVQDWKLEKKFHALVHKNTDVLFIKPQTFMNNSGEAVQAVMQFYKISVPELLVVFDDKDLPLGTIRFRTKGSSGGHNGVQSIIDHIGNTQFNRFKVGIAPITEDAKIDDTADYVLGKFTREEAKQLPEIVDRVTKKIQEWVEKTPTHPNV